MKEYLMSLERQIDHYARPSSFNQEQLQLFPENSRQIHSYKIFGDHLLAIPAHIIIKGDEDEFEVPFRFLENEQELNGFETEFRAVVPHHFMPVGYLCELEIVLINKTNNCVYVFHVADIADKDWIKYKLEKPLCSWETFVKNLRPQTVCCFINPNKYSEYDMFEIRNKTELMSYTGNIQCTNEEEVWKEYNRSIQASINKGFEIIYAPKKVMEAMQ